MNPGDVFLLPDPGYPDYWSGATLGQVTFEKVPLLKENNFLPDLKSIPEELAKKLNFSILTILIIRQVRLQPENFTKN